MINQTLQKTTSEQRSKKKKPRYLLLWEHIQSLQAKLDSLETTNKTILRHFSTTIRPLEESITHELIELTKSLIARFHDDGSEANRSLLGFWVIDNFSTLTAHPFANLAEVEALYDSWRIPIQGTDDMVEAQLSLLMAQRNDMPGQSKLRTNYPDADMFAASRKSVDVQNRPSTVNARPSHEDNSTNSECDDFSDESIENPSNSKTRQTTSNDTLVDKLKKEKKSTKKHAHNLGELFDIDKLFRRIARSVHPDREQDENKKAEKHAIMSACLQARENEDIAQLLELYSRHVGNLPDSWSDESTGELVTALEKQLRELEARYATNQYQDPALQLILNRYSGYDKHDVERRIKQHKESLTVEIDRLKVQRNSLETDEGWALALKERRDIELDKLAVAELTQ